MTRPLPDLAAVPTADMVNHPPHYTTGGIECIDALRAALGDEAFSAYCRATAIKYLWRAGKKWDGAEDLKKAAWYCTRAASVMQETAPDATTGGGR
jgi:hypothetical protein